MSRTINLAVNFLRELDSDTVQNTFDSLGVLLEHLETKDDPDPSEIQMFDAAFQALEKLKMLEGLMKNYVAQSDKIHKGNKLQKLYEKSDISGGSHVLFD